MSEPAKKVRILTEEHKAKMAAGRTAAAAKRAAEKVVTAPLTPTKVVATEAVCPPAPKKETPQEKLLALANEAKQKRLTEYRAKRAADKAAHDKKVAERREVKTKALMIEAVAPLNYYKKALAAVECIAGEKRDEVLAYFNDKIEDLEADVAGKARYDYVLGVKEDNGDTDWTQYPPYTKTFKTSQQVSAHVAQTVSNWMERRNWMERGGDEGDNDDDLNEPFPTAESIDARLGDVEYSNEIQLFAYGDPYVSCLSFTLQRNRLN